METPGIGKYTVERPVNVGYKRDKTHLEYRGAPAVRAGIGWDLKFAALEVDALYANAGMIRVDGEKIRAGDGKTDHVSPLVSSGLALHLQLDDRIRVRSGVRVRFEDPVELTFTQLGFGGSYVIDGELTAYGSAGLLIPNGSEAETGVLGDLRTFVLRAGVVYQGLME